MYLLICNVIRFHPVLIAGINSLSGKHDTHTYSLYIKTKSIITDCTYIGNQPPWMLPAKALYLDADSRRAAKRVGRPNIALPPAFQSMNITISPLRALHYIKANYSSAVFVSTVHAMFRSFWTPPHVNLTEDDKLAEVLLAATADEDGGGVGAKLFSDEDVKRIMEGRALMKDSVKRLTQQAVDKGAFGAPWLVATNGRGEEDVFFGSDR